MFRNISLSVGFMLLISLIGCGQSASPDAEEVVRKYLGYMLQGDVVTASQYTTRPERNETSQLAQMTLEMTKNTIISRVDEAGLRAKVTGSKAIEDSVRVYFSMATTKYTNAPDRTDSLTCVMGPNDTWLISEGMLVTDLLGME